MTDFIPPSYWYGGGPDFSGLQNAQNQYNQNQNYFANQNNVANQTQNQLNTLYGPLGFGGATAQAAARSAAYGRATGGFNGGQQVAPAYGQTIADFQASQGRGGDGGGAGTGNVFDTGTEAIQHLGTGGGDAMGGGGFSGGSRGGGRDFDQTFSDVAWQNQSALNAVNQFSGRGTGVGAFDVPPSNPPDQSLLGGGGRGVRDQITQTLVNGGPGGTGTGGGIDYSGGMPPGDENSFANRFAAGRYFDPGHASQYTTQSYQDAEGREHAPSDLPPGYQSLFGVDNPGGALPPGGFRGMGRSPPIMNAGQDDMGASQDTLTGRDRAIGQGSGGGFQASAFDPGQYQQEGVFGSGAGVGGSRGGSGGLGTGTGTQLANTVPPFFGGEGSGFGALGSTQNGGQYAGRGHYPGLIGAANDAYGNAFIHGNAAAYAQDAGRMGGGIGLGGLDALGQGTVYRGR
jgi:hypothetical protein